MYYSWTGKICIFITVINFPDNNRHTTVFHEKAYFSTIMEYFLQDIIAPRMSSHCYKLFNLFFLDFSIKPLFWNRGCYIVVTKSVWRMLRHCYKFSSSGRYIIATNQVNDFHSTSTLPSSYTYIPCTYSSSISRVSFS